MTENANQKPEMSADEIIEHINNLPRKYVLFKMMGKLWDMLEEQFKGNRKVDKNVPGGMFPSEQNLRAMGALYYTIMVIKEQHDTCDAKLLNKDYIANHPTPVNISETPSEP